LRAIGFRITDPCLDPPANDAFYSERSLRLPHSFWCYEAFADASPDVSDLPLDRNGLVTFGCLNNFCKVNDPALKLWARILAQLPRSRMILLAPLGEARRRTLKTLQRLGIDSARIDFVDIQPRPDYLKLYHQIDVSLDTFPYNGHTTSLDSLWMGVPTVTLIGQTAVARAGFSQLSNLGLTDLAAISHEQYVQIATDLACDRARLAQLRSSLRERMRASPLMDGAGFARSVEETLLRMWRDG
jgi:predicted O-linked N-acetylglucosamine transferase (SPINDLY family)